MRISSWLRAHRKQVITHTSIIVGFAVFLVVGAEPLFDRLETVPGASRLHRVRLPAATDDIQYYVDWISITPHLLEISGAAFVNGEDSVDAETFVVLSSTGNNYVFDTQVTDGADLTAALGILGLDLDMSGYYAVIPLTRVAEGEYAIGFFIRVGEVKALEFTDIVVRKAEDATHEIVSTSVPVTHGCDRETGGVRFQIDRVENVGRGDVELVEIVGWAFLEWEDSSDSSTHLVLRAGSDVYVFDTIPHNRFDVTAAWSELGLDLDRSGFTARIPVTSIQTGEYQLGVCIERLGVEALQYGDVQIEVKGGAS